MKPHRIQAVLGLALAFSFLAGSSFAVPLDLRGFTFLPGDDALAPAAGLQRYAEIAAGDGMYLAVWVDDRAAITHVPNLTGGPNFDRHIGSMWDIYATRLDADGNPIDATPIVVAQDIQNQGLPDVEWNGANWLVMWTGQVGLQCCPDENRYAARVSPAGAVLDSPPITLATGPAANALWRGAVGTDGTNWLTVWAVGNQVVGRRIAADGTLLDPSGQVLYTGGSPGDFDVVPGVGGGYFVVWSSGGQTSGGTILGRRFGSDLSPDGAAFACNLYSPSVGRRCRVATNGSGYFVTWWEDRWYAWSQLAGTRVGGDGTILDPNGVMLTDAYGYTNYEPAVAWDGTNWVVVYDKSAFPPIDLFASRVTTDGVVLDYEATAIPVSTASGRQYEAAIAWLPGADTAVALWTDVRYGGFGDVFAATIGSDGAVGPEHCVAIGAPRQTLPRLVSNGSGYLAAFRSETGIASRVLLQRLDASAVPIDTEPVEAVVGDLNTTWPAAAWNGSEYLVVWEDRTNNRVLGRRFAPDLTPLDAAPVDLLPGNTPDVAALGDVFLVVASYENPPQIRNIHGVRVRGGDGVVLDPSPRGIGYSYSLVPRVAAFTDRWIVTWERHPTHDDPSTSVLAGFVDAGGAATTPFTVDGSGEQPVVAVGSTEALFTFVDRNGPTVEDDDILARRMDPNGAFLDGAAFFVTTAVNAQFDPAVAWSGSEYATAFGDFRLDPQYDSKRGDLYGARIAADGTVLDPSSFVVSNDSTPEMYASVAGMDGEWLVAGAIFRPETGTGSYRIGVRGTARSATDTPAVATPSTFRLEGGRPNPARHRTTIAFELARPERVVLTVHDAGGRLVRTLLDGRRGAGRGSVAWDGRDGAGNTVGSGVYFVRMEAAGDRETRRVLMLR